LEDESKYVRIPSITTSRGFMRMFPLSLESFYYTNKLKEFALKSNDSTTEKTARIAAGILLAIPAVLLDIFAFSANLSLKLAKTIHNKFIVQQSYNDSAVYPPEYSMYPPAFEEHLIPSAPPLYTENP
jgi:hypothetical protein